MFVCMVSTGFNFVFIIYFLYLLYLFIILCLLSILMHFNLLLLFYGPIVFIFVFLNVFKKKALQPYFLKKNAFLNALMTFFFFLIQNNVFSPDL